ncbi:uncharacterized protein SCDLUD_000694 [Saccharomycodes ludwigii]|uniref:uncharacterized protein n=1 Tax=Saccharomycodes ludwigii TaxID=36035 RepID=UPI001E82F08F|nr:hypothetical protein SCDLUD_000694 [Saccharomycodes ludwigii]KAH3903083.1 hypothetical protein SCDLUD_000694 [Saccharomycodes ludwigii]
MLAIMYLITQTTCSSTLITIVGNNTKNSLYFSCFANNIHVSAFNSTFETNIKSSSQKKLYKQNPIHKERIILENLRNQQEIITENTGVKQIINDFYSPYLEQYYPRFEFNYGIPIKNNELVFVGSLKVVNDKNIGTNLGNLLKKGSDTKEYFANQQLKGAMPKLKWQFTSFIDLTDEFLNSLYTVVIADLDDSSGPYAKFVVSNIPISPEMICLLKTDNYLLTLDLHRGNVLLPFEAFTSYIDILQKFKADDDISISTNGNISRGTGGNDTKVFDVPGANRTSGKKKKNLKRQHTKIENSVFKYTKENIVMHRYIFCLYKQNSGTLFIRKDGMLKKRKNFGFPRQHEGSGNNKKSITGFIKWINVHNLELLSFNFVTL